MPAQTLSVSLSSPALLRRTGRLRPWLAAAVAVAATSVVVLPASPVALAATGSASVLGSPAGSDGVGPGRSVAQAPSDVAIDGGRLLVADGLYGVVRALDTISGVESVVARLATPASPAGIDSRRKAVTVNPMAVAPDGRGGVVVSDQRAAQVERFGADGSRTVLAGTGEAGFGGDGGPATSAQLSVPAGVAVGPDGSIYVADSGNQVVRRISPAGVISTVVGTAGAAGFAGDGGPATAARLSGPADVALDAAGRLLVADSGNTRIRRVDTAGTISTVVGNGTRPSNPELRCPTNGAPATSWIENPTAVTTDGQGRIIATAANCVIAASGGTLTTVAGTGLNLQRVTTGPAGQAALDSPVGVAVAPSGAVYVAAGRQGQVERVTPDGIIATVAGVTVLDAAGYVQGRFDSGDHRPAVSSQLPDVTGLATAPDGTVTFSDSLDGAIRSVSPDSTLSPISSLSDGSTGAYGPNSGNLLKDTGFTRTTLGYDGTGNLLIIDLDQNMLYRVGADGRLTLLAGSHAECSAHDGDGGPATAAVLDSPSAVAADSAGNVYLAERFTGRIRKITPAGTISTLVGGFTRQCTGTTFFPGPLSNLDALAVAADGTVWVTGGGCLSSVSATGAAHQCVEAVDSGAGHSHGGGVGVRPDGTVVYSDPGRQVVRQRAPDGTVTTVAGQGVPVGAPPPPPGCGADGQSATSAPLNLPTSLTLTADGTVVVFDAGCHNLRTAGSSTTLARTVTRLAGPDRLVTGVEIARNTYPPGTAAAAVLARADSYADALAGAPLAAHLHGPLLLTGRDGLSAWTESELRLALPTGRPVAVLGGTSAISATVDSRLRQLGYTVTRYAGADRYATSAAIARDGIGNPTATFLTTGTAFPDALSASAAAASNGGAVLLTAGTSMPAATADYLAGHPGTTYAVGGPAAQADPAATPLVGSDRYATSAAVAQQFFPHPGTVTLANGLAFADALTGAAAAATHAAPLLLTDPLRLSPPARDYLTGSKNPTTTGYVYGGAAAVTGTVADQIRQALT